MRRQFLITSVLVFVVLGVGTYLWHPIGFLLGPASALFVLGLVDMTQTKQAVRRNFPVIGHGRYLLEAIRPEINQYFIESNTDGQPFSRETRSVVYQRAKGELDTVPFGTQHDLYEPGAEWIQHSILPRPVPAEPPRVTIGETTCTEPYRASLLNISAMSYGSLSNNAILALSLGAKKGDFAHNTGEGGISPYHLKGGADLIWQIGTGYFGCRGKDAKFDAGAYRERARIASVKMIELKISQGAKPGHGGILPGRKVNLEIATIRGVPIGQDVISPPGHSAFSTPIQLLEFITQLRELSGGKPVGIKLCVGKKREFFSVCKAMLKTGLHPDYIAIDGAEGGTGAAPLEFTNRLGMPLTEALIFVHNALVGTDLRDKIKLFAAGKVATGFDLLRLLAIGADACYSARAMMLALGCIQARRCNNNTCPVGVATQDPDLTHGLVVEAKAPRIARFHRETLESFLELLAASGCSHPMELRPWHVHRRITPTEVRHYAELHEYLAPGALLQTPTPQSYERAWRHASAERFTPVASMLPPAIERRSSPRPDSPS